MDTDRQIEVWLQNVVDAEQERSILDMSLLRETPALVSEALERLKCNQQYLAMKLGVDQSYVSLLRSGKRMMPKSILEKLVRLLKDAQWWTVCQDEDEDWTSDWWVSQEGGGCLWYEGYELLRLLHGRHLWSEPSLDYLDDTGVTYGKSG
jgi:hypothetical protein